MTMTDPIADMLTRVRNANQAYKDETTMPASKIKVGIAKILKAEGYIEDFEVTPNGDRPGSTLTVTMKYSPERARTISGLRRVSKPGLRVYAGAEELPKVLKGLGIAIVSTSKGVMTDKKARELNVGGEVLAFVW